MVLTAMFNGRKSMFLQGNLRAYINLLLSRAVLKSDVRIRNVQSSELKSVTSNITLVMPWKRRNQNTCRERAFFAEILSPNIKIFQRIFFKLSSVLVSQNVFLQ